MAHGLAILLFNNGTE